MAYLLTLYVCYGLAHQYVDATLTFLKFTDLSAIAKIWHTNKCAVVLATIQYFGKMPWIDGSHVYWTTKYVKVSNTFVHSVIAFIGHKVS